MRKPREFRQDRVKKLDSQRGRRGRGFFSSFKMIIEVSPIGDGVCLNNVLFTLKKWRLVSGNVA